MNFRLLTWLDPFALAASLPRREGLFKTHDPGHRFLQIRGLRSGTEEADENFVGYQAVAKWPELGNLRARIKRLGDALLGEVEFGRIFFEMLDASTTLPWRVETTPYFERFERLHLPIRTNPGAVMLAGGRDGTEAFAPAPGQLFAVPTRLWCSAVNLGEMPRVHLVIDFRRKLPTGDDD